MKLYVRDIDISSGGVHVALVNKQDALEMDIHVGDRIRVIKNKRIAHVVVDIAQSDRFIQKGEIGLFEEVMKSLKTSNYDKVSIELSNKPKSVQYIRSKLDGIKLNQKETFEIVDDIVENRLTDIELAYFVSGCYTQGLDKTETLNLTKAIAQTGNTLKLNRKMIVDKHCIGGVPGNRTTMCLVPMLVAAGFSVPKTSSRAITSPAGTADTMEVLANVNFEIKQLKNIIKDVGGFIVWGGSMNLAAADDKLIRIRHTISLDPEGMLLASIMAKKASVGSKYVLIDIPIGPDVKQKTRSSANKLKKKFIELGKELGMKVNVIITDGSQPIGYGMGASLEARDVLKLLQNDPSAPQDLRKKVIKMASIIFDDLKKDIKDKTAKTMTSLNYAKYLLDSGIAYNVFKKMISAQGGNPNIDPDDIKLGKFVNYYSAPKSGKIISINNKIISRIARVLGSPVDKGSGLFLKVKKGYLVKKGDPLFIAYSLTKDKMDFAKNLFKDAIVIKRG